MVSHVGVRLYPTKHSIKCEQRTKTISGMQMCSQGTFLWKPLVAVSDTRRGHRSKRRGLLKREGRASRMVAFVLC